jgi:hypothetical protein
MFLIIIDGSDERTSSWINRIKTSRLSETSVTGYLSNRRDIPEASNLCTGMWCHVYRLFRTFWGSSTLDIDDKDMFLRNVGNYLLNSSPLLSLKSVILIVECDAICSGKLLAKFQLSSNLDIRGEDMSLRNVGRDLPNWSPLHPHIDMSLPVIHTGVLCEVVPLGFRDRAPQKPVFTTVVLQA